MNFYQMNPQNIADQLHSDISMGKINEDISLKTKENEGFKSFFISMMHEVKLLFSFLDLLPIICYMITLFFAVLNRQMDLLFSTVFAIVITAFLYFGIIAMLCIYRRRFQSRIDQNAQMVSVIRSGEIHSVPASDLEIGDLIVLKKGVLLHGDARIIEGEDLYMNEQLVFSVSIPVKKTVEILEENNLPPEQQSNMLWKGSFVANGEGLAIITALGEDCYIEKTGGRKGVRQRSWFYNKQKNIGHLGAYIYIIFLALMILLALIFTSRFTDAILVMGALGSVVMLNPFLLITEWNYYRNAELLYQKGAHIRNIEAFDGMNRERTLYYSSDELIEGDLLLSSIDPISVDERSCISYFALCLREHPMAGSLDQALRHHEVDRSALVREFPNYRSEFDKDGNVFSVFAEEEQSVVVATGYWEKILPLIGVADDDLLVRINQLEQEGRLVWLLCYKAVSSIPNQLNVEEYRGKMSPMGLIAFESSKREDIAEKIIELRRSKMKVFLVNRYHAQFGEKLAETYGMDGCLPAPPEKPCYTLPRLNENPYVVYDDVSPIKIERAKLILSGEISAQDVIYQVKCMFCGIKRSIGFFTCFSALLIVAAFVFFLRELPLVKLIIPIVLLKPALICVFYYLVETVGNCNQYKRSLILGAICGGIGCAAALFGFDIAFLSMPLSTVLLSIVFLLNVRKIRVIRKKDLLILLIAILAVVIPWIFLGGNWPAAVLFALLPPVISYIINLFY